MPVGLKRQKSDGYRHHWIGVVSAVLVQTLSYLPRISAPRCILGMEMLEVLGFGKDDGRSDRYRILDRADMIDAVLVQMSCSRRVDRAADTEKFEAGTEGEAGVYLFAEFEAKNFEPCGLVWVVLLGQALVLVITAIRGLWLWISSPC